MDNLSTATSSARTTAAVLKHRHTWVMSFLYIGTFGSFIGYSAALPLLIKLNFFVPTPAPAGTGINFAYYAFLGALVGSITRPFGGWLADKYGGARVTVATFGAMIVGTLGVLWALSRLTPNPTADPAIALDNTSMFPWFLVAFLFVFAATGIGNGSTFRMIPAIWKRDTKQSSAVIGIASAVGALGGFAIPLAFGAPWIDDPVEAVRSAFAVFTLFYVVCLAVTWGVYVRKASVAKVAGLAEARI
jgi:NNP family nitrate/nitrite transporter-like MFS transporter